MKLNSLESRVQQLETAGAIPLFTGIKRGFEKESLRINADTHLLATTSHPIKLGSALTHPMITTDYSEALLEFITPPTESITTLFNTLDELHRFTYQMLDHEYLWSASMPGKLPHEEESIPIAYYGTSNLGQRKHIYRRGLGLRYGRKMQTIAGIHYNFSLSEEFWQCAAESKIFAYSESAQNIQWKFISEQYLGMLRNVLRWGWLLPYLFGASPVISSTFVKRAMPGMKLICDSWVAEEGTSLRLSNLGYNNVGQAKINISYNNLDAFLKDMHQAVHTSSPQYRALGLKDSKGDYQQLSDAWLQVEDEHYSSIRPKRVSKSNERMLTAIRERGIEYIELRALDINPFLSLGIEESTVHFLDCFLVTCLLLESPPLLDAELEKIKYNHAQVVFKGRQPGLRLQSLSAESEQDLKSLAQDFLKGVSTVAKMLDQAYTTRAFSQAVTIALQSLDVPENLISARLLEEMRSTGESYCAFANRWSKKHGQEFRLKSLSQQKMHFYQQLAETSLAQQQGLEQNKTPFEDYLKHYLED